MLTDQQIEDFIRDGFVKIEDAFPAETAAACREILWEATGLNPGDPATWTKPVIRLGMFTQAPFIESASTPQLTEAFDQLVGPGNWLPVESMGTFPVRFPSKEDPGDAGWHVDASYPGYDGASYLEWRINVKSKGRGLLMLFLYSDVSDRDAPTRIRTGSHADVARKLSEAGDEGFSFMELAMQLSSLPSRRQALATGKAGTVYLCHPFLVHAAQQHYGTQPKFMAQPPLLIKDAFDLDGEEAGKIPVAAAVKYALG